MTASRDPDRLIHRFLLEGEEQLDDRVYDAVRAAIERQRQRVVIGPWRMPVMNRIAAIGLGAAAVIAVVFIGAQLLGTPGGGFGGPGDEDPTPTPEASVAEPTAEPTSTPEPGLPQGRFDFEDSGLAMSVTIPASGWTFGEPTLLRKGMEVQNMPEAAILFWAFPGQQIYVYEDPCRATSTRPETPASTVDEISAALAAQASRDASEPVDVTVGGYEGKRLTLHTPEDAVPGECELDQFAMYGTEGDPLGRYSQGPGQIDELWILDVGGTIVIIDAMSRSDSRPELLEEMRSIVQSTTFEAP